MYVLATEKSKIHIFEGDINKEGRAGGYHNDMVEGTSGNIIEGTKGPALNDAGIKEGIKIGIVLTDDGKIITVYPTVSE